MPKPLLFVSHDAKGDAPLALELLKLIEMGVGVKHPQVFCTSQKGQGVEVGQGFNEEIRQQLRKAKVVLALITENFWASPFCIAELGGAWYDGGKVLLPVLVPPLGYDDLQGVVSQKEALKLDHDDDLGRLWDKLTNALQIEPRVPTPKWDRAKEEFLERLPVVLKQCPPRAPVPREALEKVKQQLAEYKAEYNKLADEKQKLNSHIADLSKLKDKAAVAKVARKHTGVIDQFTALVEAARKALAPLPKIVEEALYLRTRGEELNPSSDDDFDAVNSAAQDGYMNNPGDEAPSLRPEHRKVRAAIDALKALEEWLDDDQPEAFYDWYDTTFGGEEPKIGFRPFWERHLLRGSP